MITIAVGETVFGEDGDPSAPMASPSVRSGCANRFWAALQAGPESFRRTVANASSASATSSDVRERGVPKTSASAKKRRRATVCSGSSSLLSSEGPFVAWPLAPHERSWSNCRRLASSATAVKNEVCPAAKASIMARAAADEEAKEDE